MRKKPSYKIENVVASVNLFTKLDLERLAIAFSDRGEYDPKKFPGMVFRLSKPKVAILMFSSGKLVVTGAKSLAQINMAVKRVVKELKKQGVKIERSPDIKIQNVVASANLGVEVNLEAAAEVLENSMYEPEQFPGLIYRMDDPKVVLLIFSSGKLVCTGAKNEDDVKRAVDNIYKLLKELKVLYLPEEAR